jgi:MFS superfamily sulfate permease-like transporter
VGPDALSSLLIGLTLAGEQFEDPTIDATIIAPVIAFMAGLILLILGLMRVGFIDTILSKPLLSGFINAVAVTILFEQLEPVRQHAVLNSLDRRAHRFLAWMQLFGLKTNSKVHGFRKIGYFFDQLPNLNWITFGSLIPIRTRDLCLAFPLTCGSLKFQSWVSFRSIFYF